MARQPEGKLYGKIRKQWEGEGARVIKIHGSDEGVQEVGIPDLLICYRGLFIGLEVKLPGGQLRPAQRVVLREIFNAGGIAAVVETVEQSADLLAILEVRRGLDKGLCFDRGIASRRFTL